MDFIIKVAGVERKEGRDNQWKNRVDKSSRISGMEIIWSVVA